jgi:hypothetical protein
MTAATEPNAQASPAVGDIVVDVHTRQKGQGLALVYVHTGATGAHHDRFRTREEAVAYALTCAKSQRVCAWLTDNWWDHVLLEDCRVVDTRPRTMSEGP